MAPTPVAPRRSPSEPPREPSFRACLVEMVGEPGTRQAGDLLQCTRFGKQMAGSGDDREPALAAQHPLCLSVEAKNHGIAVTNDEEGGGAHGRQPVSGEVR